MNRIQRCQAVLAGQAVDHVPVYCPAIACDVASKILGRKALGGTSSLHAAQALAYSRGPQAYEEFEQQLIQDVTDLAKALDLDVIGMPQRLALAPTIAIDDHTFLFGDPDGTHTIHRYEPTCGQFTVVHHQPQPPGNPPGISVDPVTALIQQVQQLEADTPNLPNQVARDLADYLKLHQLWGKDFFHLGMQADISAGCHEHDLLALAQAPQWMARKIMCQARRAMIVADTLAASSLPKVILGNGNLTNHTGPLYSPQTFAQIALPGYRLAIRHASWSGVHYLFQSQGNLWPIADMLFNDAGCPGFGQADREAGMSIKTLRQRYPNLIIWGNISSTFLRHATPDQVRDEAKRHIEESQGRLFFQGCAGSILHGTPAENVLALLQTRS